MSFTNVHKKKVSVHKGCAEKNEKYEFVSFKMAFLGANEHRSGSLIYRWKGIDEYYKCPSKIRLGFKRLRGKKMKNMIF